MENHNLIDKLNIRGNKLSKSHRKIADYIVNHYDKAVFLTAVSLGEAVGVSESTVVRFASALGYSGYPQMQEALQELVRHRLTTEQRFEMSENIEQDSVLTTVLKMDMQNIRNTISMIDHNAFAEAVDRLLHAHRIYILGLRSAAPLAHFLGYYLHFIFDDVVIVAEGTTDVFES
ncbi:MAG: MurR/RpiR family transcriptional regulator, partial [Clostridia bacterium]|nr:MurR/RpiR family transcriptional regulator [Clostridia bacterium]